LVYTRALGARAARREGSSPFIPTRLNMTEFDPKLSELQSINAVFDAENYDGGQVFGRDDMHVAFHVLNAANKLIRHFEQTDHGSEPDTSFIDDEVIPDLLKNALQLAELRGKNIAELYLGRLASLEARNNTPGSAERAINSVEKHN
jgi:hypothetical protein